MVDTELKKVPHNIIRNPDLVKNRIFVGNLPICTKEELESICLPYGKVVGSLVQKNFGFVQFESEEIANKVAGALSKSTFKGNVITVRNAGSKQPQKKNEKILQNSGNLASFNKNADYNDCEIIVVDHENTKYAELIEDRLKRLNLRVDVLFPNADVPLGKILSNISSRGCLYAILVTNQHEEHQSITVNILYGQPAEHRNMPVDDAIKLISEDFRNKLVREVVVSNSLEKISQLPKVISNYNVGSLKEHHPEAIQGLFNLLAEKMPLTVVQYDCIIKYLQDRREIQIKIELGNAASKAKLLPDPEIQLQKKILNILNKPSVTNASNNLLYQNLESVQEDFRLMQLLGDVRIQNAIDSLMDSNLVSIVANYMKFSE